MPWVAEAIKPEVRDCVTSFYVANESSAGQPVPAGTGFFAFVPRRSDTTRMWNFLITAKHVVLNEQTRELESPLWMRFNTKKGGAELVRIDEGLKAGPYSVFFPNDPTLDLAVMLVEPDASHVLVRSVGVEEFIGGRAKYQRTVLGEGSDVFYPTLFVSAPGVARNQPIVRFGKIALLIVERISWEGDMLDLHLVETHAYGGSSGAPVFVRTDDWKVLLLGVMKGHFIGPGHIRFEGKPLPPEQMNAAINLGIAAVIPAYLLHDFLNDVVARLKTAP